MLDMGFSFRRAPSLCCVFAPLAPKVLSVKFTVFGPARKLKTARATVSMSYNRSKLVIMTYDSARLAPCRALDRLQVLSATETASCATARSVAVVVGLNDSEERVYEDTQWLRLKYLK